MALGKISGVMLQTNLLRQGVDLQIDSDLVYFDVTHRRLGIGTTSPTQSLDTPGNARIANLSILGNTITSNTGKIGLGSISNVVITGGAANYVVITNGSGNLSFVDLNTLPEYSALNSNIVAANSAIQTINANIGAYQTYANANLATQTTNFNTLTANVGAYQIYANANAASQSTSLTILDANIGAYEVWANANLAAQSTSITSLKGNTIQLGSNTAGTLVSNAVTLTTTSTVTDSIAQLNQILGKLVPPAPPAFPGATPLTITTAVTAARICNFVQTDNSLGNVYQATAGATVSAIRTTTYTTSNLTAIGPGDSGTVTVYWNGKPAGANTLVAGGNVITSNLVIGNNMDYNKVVSTVTAGFWYSFNAYATGTALSGWNTVWIGDTSVGANTNPTLFYYDATPVVGPTWSNATTAGTNAVLTSNVVAYSSTIPHLTSGATLRLKANIANLSGDMYYTSDTFVTGTAGGAWQAPTSVAYASLSPIPATPLVRNLYQSSGSAYLETPASLVTTGFGSSSTGPTLTAFNGYSSTAQAFTTALGVTVLYKNGTATQIEETSIPVNSVGVGSGNGFRILNPGSTNNPAYTGSEAAFNSQTSTLTTTDATNVAGATAGVLKYDVTNYSTGYYPIGPNLSTGRGATQYFTFKFVRTAVSKFDIKYTGTIAGLWVAMPGLTESASYGAPTSGWYDVSTAYAGAGIPGTGSLANGSAGCAVGGNAVLNSAQTNLSVTATFGTLSSTNSTGNEIYVRVAFTSGQSLTALTIEAATH